MSKSKALELHNIKKAFGPVEVIHGVNLTIEEGEFIVFVGPSGCGKSTLLRLIAGLEDPTSGDMKLDGVRVNDVPASDRGLAMVFQSYALYPHMTVFKNLSFGLENLRVEKAEIEKRVQDASRLLQIDGLLQRRPGQLSGGQRQRVAIGRAIVRKPRIFLFDEPLSNLDAELRVQMRVEISSLHERLGNTMIYVTHDQVEAMTMADRIVVLNQGRIEQIGAPLELYNHPVNKFVAGFIGSPRINFLGGTAEVQDSSAKLHLNCGIQMDLELSNQVDFRGEISLGIRPESIHIDLKNEGELHGTVRNFEQLGSITYLYVELANQEKLTVHLSSQADVRRGQQVGISFPATECHLFRESDGVSFSAANL
ncbi:MAG: ABC transporter ATP-binding protein [Opitutales bacterium]|jgi:ABC-type sugar transport system ATPase subunit